MTILLSLSIILLLSIFAILAVIFTDVYGILKLNNKEIVINRFNEKIINGLNKKYLLTCGDKEFHFKANSPLYNYEDSEKVIFNFIEESE